MGVSVDFFPPATLFRSAWTGCVSACSAITWNIDKSAGVNLLTPTSQLVQAAYVRTAQLGQLVRLGGLLETHTHTHGYIVGWSAGKKQKGCTWLQRWISCCPPRAISNWTMAQNEWGNVNKQAKFRDVKLTLRSRNPSFDWELGGRCRLFFFLPHSSLLVLLVLSL